MISVRPNPVWKRAMDVLVALGLLVPIAPIAAVVALLIKTKLGSPILFRQLRGGHGGETFELLKFRTMSVELDDHGDLLPDALRRSAFGDKLRSASLDELPSLWNLFRGDISLVGPRPLMAKYLDRYSPRQAQRHRVQPGITGLAQVQGRNKLSWDEKFELDLEYVESRSIMLDIRILWRTVQAVFGGEGADGIDHTVEFLGALEPSQSKVGEPGLGC